MTTQAKAAICRGKHAPFAIEHVELDDLRADELRIRIIACGICHTDLAVRDGQLPVPLPIVLGHAVGHHAGESRQLAGRGR